VAGTQKQQLLARVGEALVADEVVDLPGELSERDLVGVVHRYFWGESVAEVVGRDPEELARLALEHLRLAAVRPRGAEVVAVDRPVDGPAVLRVVTDDMPFLVDSVTAEVVRQKVGLDHVVHPVVLVRRDATGNLLQFCDSPRSDDSVTESWIAVLLSRQVDDEAAHDLIAGLRTVLADVRRVHEDAARLHDRALDVAHSLEQQRGHGPTTRRRASAGTRGRCCLPCRCWRAMSLTVGTNTSRSPVARRPFRLRIS